MARATTHALARSLAALTIGVAKGQEDRARLLSPTRLSEMSQHLLAEVNGKVAEQPVTQVLDVSWPYPFMYAPSQRDSFNENPHYSYGIELPSASDVMLYPTIRGWNRNADDMCTGARLAVKAWIPGARKMQQFKAFVHLTFWGYGAPVDDEGEEGAVPIAGDLGGGVLFSG